MNVVFGMRNAEKEMLECLIFIFSAFRIPNSEFERLATRNLQLVTSFTRK